MKYDKFDWDNFWHDMFYLGVVTIFSTVFMLGSI